MTNYIRKDRFLIPAKNSNAADYYKNSLLLPHNRREFVINLFSKHVPFFIDSFINSSSKDKITEIYDSNSINKLEAILEEKLKSIFKSGNNITHLILEGYESSNHKQALFFHFAENSKIPFAASKVISRPGSSETAQTNNEQLALLELAGKLSPKYRKTIPQVYGKFYEDGFAILIQSVIEGRSMFYEIRNSIDPTKLIQDFLTSGIRWIVNLQKQTTKGTTTIDDNFVEQEIAKPIKLAADYTGLNSNNDLIEQILESSKNFYGTTLPIVSSHGDLWTRNFIVNKTDIGVVDWEHYTNNGNPFYDLFMFIMSFGLFYPKSIGKWYSPEDAFDNFLCADNYLSNHIKMNSINYISEMGFDRKSLDLFFPVFLALKCNEEHDKIRVNNTESKNNYLWTKIFNHYIKKEKLNYFG